MTRVERFAEVDGIHLFAEGFALQAQETALLLSGATMQATMWDHRFIDQLTARGIGVIAFDWRDIDVCFVNVGQDPIGVGAAYLGEDGEPVLETPPFSVRVRVEDLAAVATFITANKDKIPTARSSAL